LNDVKNAQIPKVLTDLNGWDSKFSRSCREKFLENLGGYDSGHLLGMSGDESKCRLLFYGISPIHGVDEDIGIEKAASGHGSITVKFLSGKFDSFGVARRLPETLNHGIHRGIGSGNGISQKFANQGVQAGSTRLGIVASPVKEFIINGKG
jgi:hypothetical protein